MTRPDAKAVATAGRRGPSLPLIVRGASRGFTVLLVGGIVQPWVGVLLPPLGYFWLALVAVLAFGWAAWPRSGGGMDASPVRADRVVVGVASALFSYALVVPLVLSAAGRVPWDQVGFTTATACVVGAVVGSLAPRAR